MTDRAPMSTEEVREALKTLTLACATLAGILRLGPSMWNADTRQVADTTLRNMLDVHLAITGEEIPYA